MARVFFLLIILTYLLAGIIFSLDIATKKTSQCGTQFNPYNINCVVDFLNANKKYIDSGIK